MIQISSEISAGIYPGISAENSSGIPAAIPLKLPAKNLSGVPARNSLENLSGILREIAPVIFPGDFSNDFFEISS